MRDLNSLINVIRKKKKVYILNTHEEFTMLLTRVAPEYAENHKGGVAYAEM